MAEAGGVKLSLMVLGTCANIYYLIFILHLRANLQPANIVDVFAVVAVVRPLHFAEFLRPSSLARPPGILSQAVWALRPSICARAAKANSKIEPEAAKCTCTNKTNERGDADLVDSFGRRDEERLRFQDYETT